jgi:hypothetical protein
MMATKEIKALAEQAAPHVEGLVREELAKTSQAGGSPADGSQASPGPEGTQAAPHLTAVDPATVGKYAGMVVAMLPDILAAAKKAGVPVPDKAEEAAKIGVAFFGVLFRTGLVTA